MKYGIYYQKINSRKIYNYVGPWDWADSEIRKAKRNYLYYDKIDWYKDLEQNIIQNGFLNPILVVSGELSKNDWLAIPEYGRNLGLVCNFIGGSRLFIAQKYDFDIPCIISDLDGKYDHLKNLYHSIELGNYFYDRPEKFYYTKWGLDIRSKKILKK
jgi:hypothetical protein